MLTLRRATCFLIGLMCAVPASANATFPGANGVISFDRFDPDTGVWVIEPNGLNPRPLVDPCPGPGGPGDMGWSPDGQLIVIAATCLDPGAFPDQALFVANADGSGLHQITPHGTPNPVAETPSFSADGRTILFSNLTDTSNEQQIFRVNVDGSDPVQLTHLIVGECFEPKESPDGAKIIFVGVPDDLVFQGLVPKLLEMNADGSGVHNITPPGFYSIDEADWSPDGTMIAFSGQRFAKPLGGDDHVWLMNADGSRLRRIARGSAPVFSPDGTKLVYTAYVGKPPRYHLVLQSLRGDHPPRALRALHGSVDPAWQPLP